MNICLGSVLLGNLRSFVFAGAILKYFGAAEQETVLLPSAPEIDKQLSYAGKEAEILRLDLG